MSSLHLVFSLAGLAACQKRRSTQDVVVLLGDGVYCTMLDTDIERAYVLSEDLEIRGAANIIGLATTNYTSLVELCTQHSPIVSWND